MEKKLFKITMTVLIPAVCAVLIWRWTCSHEQIHDDGTIKIVATFYPMYVFTKNVADGAQGVRVMNMASQDVGCLHDYQLKTQDMALLEQANVLVINGGGMEHFVDKVVSLRSDLSIIDASEGIEMLEISHEDDDHGADEEDELFNAHVWLDPKLACLQVEHIADGLCAADPANAGRYRENAMIYTQKLKALNNELLQLLAPLKGQKIVTFHEAFDYFAKAYGLEVAKCVAHEPGEAPSTRELAETCDAVIEHGLRALFVEPQYPHGAAEAIARETGARVYTLNPVVSGDGEADSYERIQRNNARTLLEALGS